MKQEAIDDGQLGAAAFPARQGQRRADGRQTMKPVRSRRLRSIAAVAALAAGLFGCGSEGPVAQPPPPLPPPPAFQPQPVEVELGVSGSKVTLMTAEGGGFSLDGEPFKTGVEVTAPNGNKYILELVDGQWTARFNAHEITVKLGITEETVMVAQAEDGTYWIGDMAVKSGETTATASNGYVYTLTITTDATGAIAWKATYNEPVTNVTLGLSGDTVEIRRAEDGSLLLGDMTVTSGEATVAASNGATYTLSQSEDGTWTATFLEPRTRVALGSSGESIVIRTRENGRFRARSRRVQDGSIVGSRNGNSYRLTLSEEGEWTAVFQMPDLVTVTLGTSGSAVEIETLEDGTYRIGEQALADGDAVQAANGNRYTLALSAAGQWMASYRTERVRVALGEHGGRVALFREEEGKYTLDGSPIESGTVLEGKNGGEYQLTLGPDGTWTAAYQAPVQTVPLGTSGVVVLTKLEDGKWTNFKRDFEDGKTLRTDNDSRYVLRFRNGFWSAEFVPDEVPIEGTDLVATWLEDRSGYRIGTSALLPRDGEGNVTVDGASYHVWKDNQVLYASRFDKSPLANSAAKGSYRIGTGYLVVELIEDDMDTIANESKTAIKVGGGEFPVEQLLDSGAATSEGANIVATARENITILQEDAQKLVEAFRDDPATLRLLLADYPGSAQQNVNSIFGPGVAVLKETTDADELIALFNSLIEALSSAEGFAEATREDGGGILQGAALTDNVANEIFGAAELRSRVIFGVLGDTRYGAVRTEARDRGLAVSDLSFDADDAAIGAFAYSTIDVTARSWHVQAPGSATYRGRTMAASGDGSLYGGDIELEVRLANQTVSGLVTNMEDEDGEPWVYLYGAVDAIVLPDMRLQFDADWSVPVRRGEEAIIIFHDQFVRGQNARSSFRGRLLGTGEDAGSQMTGAWSIGDLEDGASSLAGSFGAERVEASGANGSLPGGQRVDQTGAESRTAVAPTGTEIDDGVLTLRGSLYGPNLNTTESPEQWDDEAQLLEDGQRIEDTYQLSLAELFSRQDSVKGYLGRNLLDLAREEVGRLREQLVSAISLGDEPGFALQLRTTLWDEINERIRARLFGTGDEALPGTDYQNEAAIPAGDPRKWSSGYPVRGGGRPDDTAALEAVDAVLEALANPDALEAAVEEDGGGVFTRDGGDPFRAASPQEIDDIWNRAEARIELWLGSTEYTRFGAWRKQTAPSAWSGYKDRFENNENGPNAFAYSQLAQATYADARFPHGGSGTYQGKTVAVQQSEFYEGRIEMVSRWFLDLQGEDEAGILTAVISNLQNQHGDLLTYTDSDAGVERHRDIEEVVFAGIGIRVDSESRLYFAEDISGSLRISFTNRGDGDVDLGSDPTVTSFIEGKFLGRSPDGPQGVIGIWTLRDGGDTRVGVGDKLQGAFGAEFRP